MMTPSSVMAKRHIHALGTDEKAAKVVQITYTTSGPFVVISNQW
jgi:hypothetical protein